MIEWVLEDPRRMIGLGLFIGFSVVWGLFMYYTIKIHFEETDYDEG